MALPYKLRKLGVVPVPMDCLPLDGIDVSDCFDNMYWRSGQDILAAARMIRQDPRLQAIYVTNFGCGPDSFLSSYVRREMAGRLVLELELDDHSADAGLTTRCEAFFDSLGCRSMAAAGMDCLWASRLQAIEWALGARVSSDPLAWAVGHARSQASSTPAKSLQAALPLERACASEARSGLDPDQGRQVSREPRVPRACWRCSRCEDRECSKCLAPAASSFPPH